AAARPASVVARAAGSLQLLSESRAVVLLEPRTTDDLEAAREVVSVVRALHDTSRDHATRSGTHHRVVGAEAGPPLDHEVPLWLQGSDATVAALAGEVADGWMVDLDEVGV